MAPRPGLSLSSVVSEAGRLSDARGWDALSMLELAKRLKVKSPSLYNHVAGMDALRRHLCVYALDALGSALSDATVGKSGDAAVIAMAHAHRQFIKQHPGLAVATVSAPPKADKQLQAASARVVGICLAVVQSYGLPEQDALHVIRALRSAVHGFATLENQSGFGLKLDIDESFEWMVHALVAGLKSTARKHQ